VARGPGGRRAGRQGHLGHHRAATHSLAPASRRGLFCPPILGPQPNPARLTASPLPKGASGNTRTPRPMASPRNRPPARVTGDGASGGRRSGTAAAAAWGDRDEAHAGKWSARPRGDPPLYTRQIFARFPQPGPKPFHTNNLPGLHPVENLWKSCGKAVENLWKTPISGPPSPPTPPITPILTIMISSTEYSLSTVVVVDDGDEKAVHLTTRLGWPIL
jgi:hypothetical protein